MLIEGSLTTQPVVIKCAVQIPPRSPPSRSSHIANGDPGDLAWKLQNHTAPYNTVDLS